MFAKETLAEKLQTLARIFPGIPSYQEREGLRAQDKVIRAALAARIDQHVGLVDKLKADLTNLARLEHLAQLDMLCRKLQRLADHVRFARYGYAGLFSGLPVDEAKLAELYDYDLSLSQDVQALGDAVKAMIEGAKQDWQPDSVVNVQDIVATLEKRIQERELVFTRQRDSLL